MRTLIVRLSSIGDIVHTLPAFAALRRAGHTLGWLVERPGRELLIGLDGLSQIVDLPRAGEMDMSGARLARAALRQARYHTALDFQGLWKSAAWARMSGARDTVGFEGPARKEPLSRLLLRRTVSLPGGAVHVIDKNLALVRAMGVDAVGIREFPLPRSEDADAAVARGLAALQITPRSFAVLNPGGGWLSKTWPAERFGELASWLLGRGVPSIVTYGPGEEELADRVVSAGRGAARRSFPTTLVELAALLRSARVMVAADTGPLHIACAVGTPVVALFGPTDPARNGPFDPGDALVTARRPSCFPCYKRECASHAGIMNTIDVAAVTRAVERRLEGASGV